MIVSLIAAMARNRVVGIENRLPWHLPADLQHFKRITLGKPVVMGRLTYASIGRPLPGRQNIVISRQADFSAPGITVVNSPAAAIAAAGDVAELMVIGGAQIYQHFLPLAQRIYLTEVDTDAIGDAWFPVLDDAEWMESAAERRPADENNPFACRFVTLERRA